MMNKVLFIWLYVTCFPLFVAAQHYHVVSISAESVEVTKSLDECPDEKAWNAISRFKASVDSVMTPVLGMSRVAMSAGRPESLLGNWAADVLVEASTCKGGPKADFGLINVGGLRNSMPEGVVRRGDIILISPFENHLVVLEMKGTDVLELMHNIAAVRGEGVSHEVQLEISREGELLQASLSGTPIEPSRIYLVATLDYLAEGNDRMYALKKHLRMHQTGLKVREVMMESVIKNRVIDSRIEGRVHIKN